MIRSQRFTLILAAAVVPFLAASSAASAQTEKQGAAFDLFGALVRATDSDADLDTESYGLRGGYRFNNRLAVEGSLSRLNEDVDVWFADVSAKVYWGHFDRVGIYAVAGPGLFKVESVDEELTVHLGFGADIDLGERAYLRPEVRGRWLEEELRFDDGLVDYSLGIGWRF